MSNKIMFGLLFSALYLVWMLVSAPAWLMTLVLPEEVNSRGLSGTLWQGEARQLSWRGVRLNHLSWALTFSSGLPGWRVTFHDPDGLRGQVSLSPLSALRVQNAHLTMPASLARRWLTPTLPVEASGLITLHLPEGRFNHTGCQQVSGGRAQWKQAQLRSPAGSLELVKVSGTFRCTPAGALALTLSQDSHQLSLSGQGTLSPDGRYAFHGQLQTRQSTPALLALLMSQNQRKDEQGRIPWQLQGKW